MSTYFSIGEISKMFNISTQTLRLYDKLDLLKPAYINSESGYRYYSVDQFIKLDSIKMCKTMGLSLEEIKKLINRDSSIESMLDIIIKQKEVIGEKIRILENMKLHLSNFEGRIKESVNAGIDNIVLVYNKERYYIKYDYVSETQEELEMNLRKVILDAEKKFGGILSNDIGFRISYDDFVKHDKVVVKEQSIHLFNNIEYKDENMMTMPEGTYLTMYITNNSFDNRTYYNKMIKFAKDNNIQVAGDFIETDIIARVDKEGMGNNLSKIELMCVKDKINY
ncbi:helix-turn-helix domain-containing protein [uncultured Clostridium sp.]|uniref:MerR family transcriptional regulator n=1 Tax=uncultured Clostridium sp. TaxID=59620 RepID=UPI0025FEC27C|nr:helix-turn-helix domain-containing protein [uncultured Clostridium sp.]